MNTSLSNTTLNSAAPNIAATGIDSAFAPAGRSLRAAIRTVGFVGLALLVVIVAMSDVTGRAPAGAAGAGPMLAAPSAAFPFGTDLIGRDMLSETLHGLAITITHGLLAVLVTLAFGSFAGFVTARLPLGMGAGLRWIADILGAIPALLLAILYIAIAGRALAPLAAGLAVAPLAFARAYDRARALARSPHAEFTRATGITGATLMRRDLVYEFRDNFLATAARALAAVTIVLSTASFLGFGSVPPHRDLGVMIAAALPNYINAWWTAAFPALALLLLVLFARLAAALEEGERP